MNTLDLVFDETLLLRCVKFDLSAFELELSKRFEFFEVDKICSVQKGIDALEEEIRKGCSAGQKKAFKKIISDRKKYLPAISFSLDKEKDIVGILSRRRIRLSCKSKVDLPDDIANQFKLFLYELQGGLFIDGIPETKI